MATLEFETRELPDRVHLVLRGELDLSTAEKVEGELARIERSEARLIVLDLSRLTFLDSTGLRLIVGADQRARQSDRNLTVVRGPATVQRVFSITKLDNRLDMVDSESQA